MGYSVKYEREEIEVYIRDVYYEEFGDAIVPEFKKAGFCIDDYEVFNYEDPWYVKVARFMFD
jgi:hypothetical protein